MRKKGRYAGTASGGGGTQRALVSAFLREHRPPMCNKEQRSEVLKRANAWAKEMRLAGGPELHEAIQRGKAASFSHRAGGHSFGVPPCKRKRSRVNDVGDTAAATAATPSQPSVPASLPAILEELDGRDRASVSRDVDAARAEEKRQGEARSRALAEWSSKAGPTEVHTSMRAFLGHSKNAGHAVLWPPMGDLIVIHILPPFRMFAEAANSGAGLGQQKLEENWSLKHAPVVHEKLPLHQTISDRSLRPGIWNQSSCGRAGFCLCQPPERDGCKRVVEAVISKMKHWCKKKTEARKLLEDGRLVLRIFSGAVDLHLHIGMINLKTWDMCVLRMVLHDAHGALLPEGVVVASRPLELG